MSEKVIGRKFFSEHTCTLDNGMWTVHNVMGEGRLKEGEDEWEHTYIDSTAMDEKFELAYDLALQATVGEFSKLVVERGFKSMFDAKEFEENRLEEKAVSNESSDKSH